MALQETHLTDENIEQINRLFGRRLLVFNSSDAECPGASAGIAFVLNREITDTSSLSFHELIPGRAITLTTKWHNSEKMTILNVYAPNDYAAHPNFWKTIGDKCRTLSIRRPDLMMGDFNIVEEALDRAPARLDDPTATTALQDLRTALQLDDTWRQAFPTTRMFTFRTHNQMKSRLDRIYSSPQHEGNLFEWETGPSTVPTDHSMVSVRFAPINAPQVGQGRWTWPLGLVNDETLLNSVETLGLTLQTQIQAQGAGTNPDKDPQVLWDNFKKEIRKVAKKHAKVNLNKINQRIKTLKADIAETANNPEVDSSEDVRAQEAIL
ncbi:hypothetical protein JAAARDRAFT_132866, partial [Jaapia argillacea MUCL 33604]